MTPTVPTPVQVVGPISAELRAEATKVADAKGEALAEGFCSVTAYFAAVAAKQRDPSADVRVVAGFRARPGEHWSRDPHVWISVNGVHYESSPTGWPLHGDYYEAASRPVGPNIEHLCLSGALVQELLNWLTTGVDPFS